MVLEGDDHAEVGSAFGVAADGRGADKDPDQRGTKEQARLHADAALFDLGVHPFQKLAELSRDWEAGHRQAVIETKAAKLFEVNSVEPLQMLHVQDRRRRGRGFARYG